MLLNIIMQRYLTFAPYSLFMVWVWMVVQQYKNFQAFKKETGKGYSILANPFTFSSRHIDKKLEAAYKKYKHESRRLIKIWVAAAFIFLFITICVGIVTAGIQP